MYSIDKITEIEKFHSLKVEWNGILKEKTRYRPYLEHEWFQLWLDHFFVNCELLILLVKDDEETKAICPFLIRQERLKGLYIKKLELIGNIASPVRNFIFRDINSRQRETLCRYIIEFLKNSIEWDVLELHSLPDEEINLDKMESLLDDIKLKHKRFFCFGNWYYDGIDMTGDQYVESRSSNIRKNIKRYKKKLEKLGDLKFEIITDGGEKKIDAFMDNFYSVFSNSWKDWEIHLTFHRELAKIGASKGYLRLGFLFLDEKPIATQLWLVCDKIAYIVRLAYDQKFKKYIPGIILSAEIMRYIIDEDKVDEIDYLIGDEEYKKNWTPKRRERNGIYIFKNNVKGFLLSCLIINLIPFFENRPYLKFIKSFISRCLNIS